MTEFERAKAAERVCIGMPDGETITDVVITDTTVKEIVHAVCEAFGILVGRVPPDTPELRAQISECSRIGGHLFTVSKETTDDFAERVTDAIRSNALEIRGVLEQAR